MKVAGAQCSSVFGNEDLITEVIHIRTYVDDLRSEAVNMQILAKRCKPWQSKRLDGAACLYYMEYSWGKNRNESIATFS